MFDLTHSETDFYHFVSLGRKTTTCHVSSGNKQPVTIFFNEHAVLIAHQPNGSPTGQSPTHIHKHTHSRHQHRIKM